MEEIPVTEQEQMDRALMFWAANDNHIHGNQNLDQFIQQRICACWHERIATMIGG